MCCIQHSVASVVAVHVFYYQRNTADLPRVRNSRADLGLEKKNKSSLCAHFRSLGSVSSSMWDLEASFSGKGVSCFFYCILTLCKISCDYLEPLNALENSAFSYSFDCMNPEPS